MSNTQPDFVMPDGRELRFDLSLISMREYRSLVDRTKPAKEGDALIAKCAKDQVTADQMADLPYPVYRQLATAFFKKAREPLADPK